MTWKRDLQNKIASIAENIAEKCIEEARRISPVWSGAYRASHQIIFSDNYRSISRPIGLNFPKPTVRWPEPVHSLAQPIPTKIGTKRGTDVIFVINWQPYAKKLEKGYSRQAPHGIYNLIVPLTLKKLGIRFV